VTNSLSAAVAVTVTSQGSVLTQLTVSPLVVGLGPGGSQQLTTAVVAAAGATLTWSNTTSNAAIVNDPADAANPVLTVPNNAPNGTAQITISVTGTAAGFTTNTLTAVVEVQVIAASVSISALNTCVGGPPCTVTPANLAAVAGQLEVVLNINSGNQKVDSVIVSFGAPNAGQCLTGVAFVRAEGEAFGVNGAPTDPITISINTAEFDPATFNPLWLNTLQCVQARIFPSVGTLQPTGTFTNPFQLANADVVFFPSAAVGTTGSAPGLQHTGNSAAGPGGTWWRGGFTWRAFPVLYSGTANVASITFNSSVCGAVASAGPPNYVATFTCAAIETAPTQNITNAFTVNYAGTYIPFAVPTAAYVGFPPPGGFPAGTIFWTAAATTTREDNRGPVTHTPLFVNAGASIGGGLWTGNGSAGTALFQPTLFQLAAAAATPPTTYTVTATDFGVGGATTPTITETTTGTTFNSGSSPALIPLAETLTPVVYSNRGNASTDALGNVGLTNGTVSGCAGGVPVSTTNRCAVSGVFGVDLFVLDARYSDGLYTSVNGIAGAAAPVRYQGANGSAVLGTGIFTTLGAAVAPAALWGPINGATDLILAEAIDTRSGLNNPAAFHQAVRRFNATGSTNCYTSVTTIGDPLNDVVSPGNGYVRNPIAAVGGSAAIDCTFGAGAPVSGYYTWTGFVADRANNAKKIFRGVGAGTVVDSIWIAIDNVLPNITGIGMQTGTYVGGAAANYGFAANDDLELKDGQLTFQFLGPAGVPCGAPCASGTGVAFLGPMGGVQYPYGVPAYTSGSFGTPFDGTIVNVLNFSTQLTLGYYITRYDWTDGTAFLSAGAPGGPTGNVALTAFGEIQSNIIANVRDVAFQSAVAPIVGNVLNTQITDRPSGGAMPAGGLAWTTMRDWRIMSKAGGSIIVRDAAPTSFGAKFCDRVDIYEAMNVGGVAPAAGMLANDASLGDAAGDGLRWRHTIVESGANPSLTDNGFERFWTYTSGALPALPLGVPAGAPGTGLFTAACIKSGSALLTPLF
jgi:hypothetical protein